MKAMLSREVTQALVDHGIVPPDCARVELVMPADGAFILRYEVFVTADGLTKLAAAFMAMAEIERR